MITLLFESVGTCSDIELLPASGHQPFLVPVAEKLACIVVDGDPVAWYNYGMDVAEASAHKTSFIGVNLMSHVPSDPYNLNLLSSMSANPERRTESQSTEYKVLLNIFQSAVNKWDWTVDQVERMCNVCVLGPDTNESAKNCAQMFFQCRSNEAHGMRNSLLNLPHPELCSSDAIPNCNTFIRLMAHMCFLYQWAEVKGPIGAIVNYIYRKERLWWLLEDFKTTFGEEFTGRIPLSISSMSDAEICQKEPGILIQLYQRQSKK